MSAPVKHYNVVDMVVWRERAPEPGAVGFASFPKYDLLLITRGNEPYLGKLALPGGFIDEGETYRQAASRELLEETGIVVDPESWRLKGVFDEPGRDPRGPVRAIAVEAVVPADAVPFAGDDATSASFISFDSFDRNDLAFDHGEIITAAVYR